MGHGISNVNVSTESLDAAVNIVNIVAVETVSMEFPWDSLGCADSKFR